MEGDFRRRRRPRNGLRAWPKTRGGQQSELNPIPIKLWEDFKQYVNKLDHKRYIFRGQEDSKWRLRTSFYRTGRANLEKYILHDVTDLQKALSALTQHAFDLNNPLHYGAFINLVQHHGYPTPLLDWTWSPYVAAFFAFRNIRMNAAIEKEKKIRIFKFDIVEWNKLPHARTVFPTMPHVSILDALAFGNTRALPQQSISTLSNIDDIESHIQQVGKNMSKSYLEVFDIHASERHHVMRELALMGITAGSMFPGLEGACESLSSESVIFCQSQRHEGEAIRSVLPLSLPVSGLVQKVLAEWLRAREPGLFMPRPSSSDSGLCSDMMQSKTWRCCASA